MWCWNSTVTLTTDKVKKRLSAVKLLIENLTADLQLIHLHFVRTLIITDIGSLSDLLLTK